MFKKNLLFLAAIFILLVPDFIIASNNSIFIFILNITFKILFFLGIGAILLYFTKSYYKSYLILGSFYLISSLTEIITVILFKNYSTLDNIKAIFFVRPNEISSFAEGFYLYLFIPIIVFVLFFIFLKRIKKIEYKKNKKTLLYSLLFFLLSTATSTYLIAQTPIIYSGKNITKYILKKYYVKQHPISFYYRTYELIISRIRYNKYIKVKEAFNFNVMKEDKESPDNVIFVIGERTRYLNWSINGYERKTSPNLDTISNLISFNKHHSNGNSTAGSIPYLLTQGTPKNPTLIYSQKTIVSLFKEADYKTYWIANQFIFDYIEHDKEPDVFVKLYWQPNNTDLGVLPVLDSILKIKEPKKKLIIINLAGGHGIIPEEFSKFKPYTNSENHGISKENKEKIVNGYDNMILLQDHVLGKIIDFSKKQNNSSFMLYTADHGTNLFDSDNNNLFGYGSMNPTKNETNVPMFFWSSEKFKQSFPYKFRALNNHKNLLTTNDNIFYTLADLSNINYPDYKRTLSLSDSTYIEPKERYMYLNNSYIKIKND